MPPTHTSDVQACGKGNSSQLVVAARRMLVSVPTAGLPMIRSESLRAIRRLRRSGRSSVLGALTNGSFIMASRINGRTPASKRGIVSKLALAAVSSLAMLASASAQEACDFFKNKTVQLVVPFSTGGGFDIYGRMVAKYMGPELGASAMIVLNQPGAGGLLATNKMWVAKPDGLTIELTSTSGMITSELGGAEGANFKSNEFSWIGRVSGEPDVIATAPSGSIKTVDDLRALGSDRKIRIGSSGMGDIDYIEATLLTEVLGLNSEIITGFEGAPEVYASLGRGEIDLFTSSQSAGFQAEKAETGKITWVLSTEKTADMPDVPAIVDFVGPDKVSLIKAQADVVAAGRSLAGPPGMAEDRLACLRDAFDRTVANPDLIAESQQLKRPLAPLTGQQVADLVRGVTADAPAEYVEIVRKSFGN